MPDVIAALGSTEILADVVFGADDAGSLGPCTKGDPFMIDPKSRLSFAEDVLTATVSLHLPRTIPFMMGLPGSVGLPASSTMCFPPASAPLLPDIMDTSLAFLNPHCCPCPASPRLSTATKLALTLLTGLLEIDGSDSAGDRPRLGGDVDKSELLFSNIARRFRTPPAPELALLADMTAEEGAMSARLSLPKVTAYTRQRKCDPW